MTALSRLLLAPLRPLRGDVRVSRVTPAVEASIARAVESRRAWERAVSTWAARELAAVLCDRRCHDAWVARRIAAGMCGTCGRSPAPEGRRTCRGCVERIHAARARREADRLARGMCARCGVRELASTLRCVECLAMEAAYAMGRYRARVSDGCVNGGVR